MSGRLSEKTAIVIGAGSSGAGWGNGKATAVAFAREGAAVLCVDIDLEAAEETAAIIRQEEGIAAACRADASVAGEVAAAVELCVERFGSLDILDNDVGIVETGTVVDFPEERWDRIFRVNLKSCFLAMKYAIPIMERQGGGAIVNISSITSLRHTGVPYTGYYTTKAAMNHLTATTAIDYAAAGIRVNSVLPGLMKTPMVEVAAGLADTYGDGDIDQMWEERDSQVPMGHMGEAWDVANAAVFLASPEARYITGATLVVDGGLTLRCA